MEIEETVILNGEEKKLYREYKDPDKALEFIKETYPETLKWLQEKYFENSKKESVPEKLGKLSKWNWERYENIASLYDVS